MAWLVFGYGDGKLVKYLFARAQRVLVEQLAASDVLLAFDFDGTLAPIVDSRDEARMRPATRRLFRDVCLRYPCAVLSGRSRDDVRARLEGANVRWIVGNHGMEADDRRSPFEAVVEERRRGLEARLAGAPGLEIEDKRLSLAVHYRKAKQKDEARAVIADAVGAVWPDARIVAGKQVVNLLPQGAPHKGSALDAIRRLSGATSALYVGDDVTDEDVFARANADRLFSVRVQKSSRSVAPYFLRDQEEIDELLTIFVSARVVEGEVSLDDRQA